MTTYTPEDIDEMDKYYLDWVIHHSICDCGHERMEHNRPDSKMMFVRCSVVGCGCSGFRSDHVETHGNRPVTY